MRNRWGIEIKKGYHAWGKWGNSRAPVDGTIIAIDRTSNFARAYGAQVTLQDSRGEFTIGADEISEVLPPMRVTKGGVVKANPIANEIAGYPRVAWMGGTMLSDPAFLSPKARAAFEKVARAYLDEQIEIFTQHWGDEPDPDTLDVFKSRAFGDAWATIRDAFPKEEARMKKLGYARHGNPTPRLQSPTQLSQRARTLPNGKTTKRPSTRLQIRRALTHNDAPPGVWANPLTRVKLKSPSMRDGEAPSERLTKRRRETARAPAGFYANPAPAFLYVVHRADANGQPAYMMAAFRSKADAVAAAKKYANGSGTPYVIEKKPL